MQPDVSKPEQSLAHARVLYETGLTDLLSVLDAQRHLNQVEARLIRSETEVLTTVIALYKALGGGWEAFEGTDAELAQR